MRIMDRIRAKLFGLTLDQYDSVRAFMSGAPDMKNYKGNSLILGGPTSWSWNATLDTTHHGSLNGPANAHRHGDLDNIGADDHHAAFTSSDHDAIGDSSPHHPQAHDMDSGSDHNPGTTGDLPYVDGTPAWALLAIGTADQVLTVSGGVPAWTDPSGVTVEHGNEKHDPDFYPKNGGQLLTAPLSMELTDPTDEPSAVAGNEGQLYYLTPGSGDQGILKHIQMNSTGSFEQVQIAVST